MGGFSLPAPPWFYGRGFNIAIHIRIYRHFSVFFLSVVSDPLQWLVDLFHRVAESESKIFDSDSLT